MVDTGFFVPPEKLPRFAGCGYFTDPTTGTRTRMDADGAASAYATRPSSPPAQQASLVIGDSPRAESADERGHHGLLRRLEVDRGS
jgi:hypothetical protein